MAEEEKRVPNYNPEEDDKEYIGTKLLDSIERGVGNWYQDERTLEGWEYLNPLSVATATAIRGVEGVGWVLGNTPGASQLLQGIGWAEDRLAEGARNISGALTPDLDPRFAGWGSRLATAILADKGLRKANVAGKLSKGYSKVKSAVKETIEEGAERAAVRSGKKYTSTRPETMSDVWVDDDLAGPAHTYERYSKKGYYPKNPPADLWDDTPEMTKPQSTAYGDDLSVVPTDDLKGLEKVSQATGEPIDVIALREGLLNRIDNPELPSISDELNKIAAKNKLEAQLKRMDEAAGIQQKQVQKNRAQFSRVLKRRIRQYVEEFKGSDADINEILSETNRIFKKEGATHLRIRQGVAWLNSYFNKLGREISEDGLSMRQLRIADIDGKPRLVHDNASGKGIKIYKSAFEKDHTKARTIFEQLAKLSDDPELFAGADFSDNLNAVLTVFNRAKKDFDVKGIAIPDEVLRATGSSTSLRELVRRNLDPKFDAKFQRIPERFRETARKHMIEDIVHTKSKNISKLGIQRIVNRHLRWWDEFGDMMVQLEDFVPADVLKQLDEQLKVNPQEALLQLETTNVWSQLSKSLKDRWRQLRDKFVQEEGGLRRRPKPQFYDKNYD